MSSTNEQPSKVTAIKDQALGTIKETVGNLLGNEKMELKGKAQKVHGKNELAYVKAQKNGESEPEHFQEAYGHNADHPQQTSEQPINQVSPQPTNDINNPPQVPPHPQNIPQNQNIVQNQPGTGMPSIPPPAPVAPGPNQPIGTEIPPAPHNDNFNTVPLPPSATGAAPPPTNTSQPAEGTVEGENVSKLGGLMDKTMGSIKETFGSATGNQNMEIQGKAQNIHGHHQEEFAKAQKDGLNEPAHFEKGTKALDENKAEGSVEGQNKPSSLSAIKDQTIGSIKESFGSATGNMNTEIAGAAQKMHGKNEAEFAKAQKEGLNEPAHFEHGTKTTDTAQGEVIGENDPSKMSGYKNQAVGSMKEQLGSATGNQNMEIAGKAQKMQGSTECNLADAQQNPTNA